MNSYKTVNSNILDASVVVQKLKDYINIKYKYITKRSLEITIILLLLPFIAFISLYTIYRIRQESKGSIFFKQPRVGLNGKIFSCYKFRSMHENSKFNPYTQDNDSRIFPYGQIMRKMRIDELPQFWNVIKGDMHLIGPRAEWNILTKEYELKIPNYNKRHLVRPGITGLAQVYYPYGRNLQDAKNKLKYDLLYIKNWSLWLEIRIIWLTMMVVFGKKGM
jgi:lipopolysaccharide/colanic/teichoic acid biosynthesis glycosyltransferase